MPTATWPSGRGGRRSTCSARAPPQVVVGRYADVHQVFSDTETFASEMPRGPGWEQFHKFMDAQFVTQMDGEQHARIRRLLMPAFSSRRIEQLEASITRIIDGMLDQIEANGPNFDAMQDLGAHLVVDALLEAMIEMDPRRKSDLRRLPRRAAGHHLHQAGRAVPGGLPASRCSALMDEIKVIIEERQAKPHSDFISDLVNAREAGDKLTDKELFDQIFGLAGGSLSATSRAAGGALYLLYTHDDQRQQLIDNPSLIPDAIEECLRLGSNGYFTFPRVATKDTEVGGTRILKGMVVRPSPLVAELRSRRVPRSAALRHPSQAEAHPVVRRRPASLHRQHPRPHHHHHRDHAAAGALPEGAHDRSELHAGLWRRGRRTAAAKPADADALNYRLSFRRAESASHDCRAGFERLIGSGQRGTVP